MSPRIQPSFLVLIVAFTALVYWIDRPFRTPISPDPARLTEMLNRDPGEPDHTYWGPGRVLWTRIIVFFKGWSLPVPNDMYLIPKGDVWMYRFPADSTYAPASHPLDCEIDSFIRDATLFCRHETQRGGQRWSYTLSQTAGEDSALFVVRITEPVKGR